MKKQAKIIPKFNQMTPRHPIDHSSVCKNESIYEFDHYTKGMNSNSIVFKKPYYADFTKTTDRGKGYLNPPEDNLLVKNLD